MQQCLFCGHTVQLVHVHGHYQCPVCNTNALPCCDGDNCDTNLLLQDPQPGLFPAEAMSKQQQRITPSAD